jgi:hypothetical protein
MVVVKKVSVDEPGRVPPATQLAEMSDAPKKKKEKKKKGNSREFLRGIIVSHLSSIS